MPKHKNVANAEYAAAMRALRRSSAAQPQESRNKRLRTKDAIIRRAVKEDER